MGGLTGASFISCNNIRKNVMGLYRFAGYETGMLRHYYRLAQKQRYHVAKIKNAAMPQPGGGAALYLIKDAAKLRQHFVFNEGVRPHKDCWYFERRYFGYPYGQYSVYRAEFDDGSSGLLVCRFVEVMGVFVMRIVDFYAQPQKFAQLGKAIDGLMRTNACEYADMYCYGVDEQTANAAGFVLRTEQDENTIPNYLEPPLFENIDYYFSAQNLENFVMYKADGDQDRPPPTPLR